MNAGSKKIIHEFLRGDGTSPYREWIDKLDISARARIQARVLRFEGGNIGDSKSVGDGVWEARFYFGPGYRLYLGFDGINIVLLLLGGDKKSQRRDIEQAKIFWREFCDGKEKS